MNEARIVSPVFLQHLRKQFLLDWHGAHGGAHWSRVYRHGQVLGKQLGADLRVAELFAFIHDSRRQDEYEDPDHGNRAADFAAYLRKKRLFELDDYAFGLLQQACRGHSAGQIEADLTVQVCWDADRLDLGRVGIRPDPRYLCTAPAREPTFIESAWKWSTGSRERTTPAQPVAHYVDEEGLTRLSDMW